MSGAGPTAGAADKAANVLAAAGLLVADAQLKAIEAATGLQASAAAALVTIGHAPDQPIDFLRQVLGRSHSAVVRLVGQLESDGLVVKRHGADRRAVSLALTARGRRLVRKALDERLRALRPILEGLGEQDRASFVALLERVLGSAVSEEIDAYRVCRLCDGDACADPCPVEAALGDA